MAKKKNEAPVRATGKPIDSTYTEIYRGGVTINPLAVLKEELTFTNGGTEPTYLPKGYDFIMDRPDLGKTYRVKGEWAKEYIEKPTATKQITENGVHDVLHYANVNVNVESGGKEVPISIFIGVAQSPDQVQIINPSDGTTYTTINLKPDEIRDLDTSLIFADEDLTNMPTKQEIETRLQNLPEAYEIDYTADPGSVIISYAGYNEYDNDFYTKLSLILMVRRA